MALTVTYIAGEGGTIQGAKNQTINYGESTTEVIAKPSSGYTFSHWSDGKTTTNRVDANIKANATYTAIFTKNIPQATLTITYVAGTGGTIQGTKSQTINYGGNTTEVTANPNSGYMFSHWSDGKDTAERIDENITHQFSVIAIFKITTKNFAYKYNYATGNNSEESVQLRHDLLHDNPLIVPARENFNFNGWFLDKNFDVQVADEQGNITIGHEIFDSESDSLYAKYTAAKQSTYKILLVFVTEAHAVLTTAEGVDIAVDYVMNDIERQVCALMPFMVEKTLNEMMEGLVIFDVDYYFTEEPIGKNSFRAGTTSTGFKGYSVMANEIPEVSGMLADYRSVLTAFCMNDYDGLLHNSGGSAGRKYGCIYLEGLFEQFYFYNNGPIEQMFDLSNPRWEFFLSAYIHEFTHTVESYFIWGDILEYHDALIYLTSKIPNLERTKLYLLRNILYDGKLEGIPYSFWQDPTNIFTFVYNGATGGNSKTSVELTYNNFWNANIIPKPSKVGYKFEGWYLEPDLKTKAFEYHGGRLIKGDKIFFVESEYLYAKWIPID